MSICVIPYDIIQKRPLEMFLTPSDFNNVGTPYIKHDVNFRSAKCLYIVSCLGFARAPYPQPFLHLPQRCPSTVVPIRRLRVELGQMVSISKYRDTIRYRYQTFKV